MQLIIPTDPNECAFNVSARDCAEAMRKMQDAKPQAVQVTPPEAAAAGLECGDSACEGCMAGSTTCMYNKNEENVMTEKGYEVKSPCGRAWFVPHSAIVQDYADFLVQADGLSENDALAKSREDCDIECWFCEQFNWSDVRRMGVLIKEASAKDIERALNFVQSNSGESAADDYKEVSNRVVKNKK